MKRDISGYYFITCAEISRRGNLSDVKEAISAGVGVVQYRNKNAGTSELYKEALSLRKMCKRAIFLVNDRVDIAVAVNADGVHLGQGDLPYRIARKMLGKNKIIGITAHSVKEALEAEKTGADYIGVSPVFGTSTKSDAGKPIGIGGLAEIRKKISIPIVAIGGIGLSNTAEVVKAGADAVCAISAVITKSGVRSEIKKFQKFFDFARKERQYVRTR